MSSQEPLGLVNKIKDMKAKPFIANSQVKQKWKYKYLYTWHIANVTRSPKYWSWRRYFLTYYLLTKLKVELGCRHTEHPQLMQEHPEIFYTGALMLSTINYMYWCGPTTSVTWSNGQWKIYTNSKRAVTFEHLRAKSTFLNLKTKQYVCTQVGSPKSYFCVCKDSMYIVQFQNSSRRKLCSAPHQHQ